MFPITLRIALVRFLAKIFIQKCEEKRRTIRLKKKEREERKRLQSIHVPNPNPYFPIIIVNKYMF